MANFVQDGTHFPLIQIILARCFIPRDIPKLCTAFRHAGIGSSRGSMATTTPSLFPLLREKTHQDDIGILWACFYKFWLQKLIQLSEHFSDEVGFNITNSDCRIGFRIRSPKRILREDFDIGVITVCELERCPGNDVPITQIILPSQLNRIRIHERSMRHHPEDAVNIVSRGNDFARLLR